jgi:hypothetical protein
MGLGSAEIAALVVKAVTAVVNAAQFLVYIVGRAVLSDIALSLFLHISKFAFLICLWAGFLTLVVFSFRRHRTTLILIIVLLYFIPQVQAMEPCAAAGAAG